MDCFLGGIAVLLMGLLVWFVWFTTRPNPWYLDKGDLAGVLPSPSETEAIEPRIEAFCGTCHAVPLPQSFPRDAWHDMVLRGYEFYAQSGMTHLDPPPIGATVDYYRAHAPEELVFPEVAEAATPLGVKFTVENWSSPQYSVVAPAIAHLRWARLDEDGPHRLLACDMRHGNVSAVNPKNKAAPPRVLAKLDHPCHVEPCDLDDDGALDLVVADLG